MKTWKKSMALLLTLVMLLSLGVTVFAAGETTTTGTITVENPLSGQTYTAYKIFDVTYDATKTAYSYTIDSGSEWFDTVQQYATTDNGLTLTKVDGTTTYIVTTTDKFSAPSFANALKAAAAGKTGTALTVADGKAKVEGLPLGYYFVSSTSGALCNLTTTNPTATIHDKNDIVFTKEVNKHSFDLGEEATFTLTGKVPDYTGFEKYNYSILDAAFPELQFHEDSVKVTIGGEDCTSKSSISFNKVMNAITINLSDIIMQYPIGAEIKITYTAHATETFELKNNAILSYSNDPTDPSETGRIFVQEYVYSSDVCLHKYAANTAAPEDHSKTLAGAEFVLYKLEGKGDDAAKLYFKWNEADGKVEWVENKAEASIKTTDETGEAIFYGIADGTYYLEETKAPEGYNLLQEPVEVDVDGSENRGVYLELWIANQTGAELPSTGGIGTTIFYVLGGLLVVGAAVLLITKKRMAEQ